MIKRYILPLLIAVLISSGFAYSFGQNKVNTISRDWAYIETMHFDVYFPAEHPEFGKLIALMAEERYYYIKTILKYPVSSRIPIICYGSKNEFQTTNIIYPILSEGIGGFTESLKNRVVIPFDGSYAKLEELLTHELTHAYENALDNRLLSAFNSLRPTSFPFWFSEGLPEYLSVGGEDSYNNMFILDMVVNESLPKLGMVDGYLAYRLGESFLSYIGDTYGADKVSEYFYAVRSLGDNEEASEKAFGMPFEELEDRWRFQLKRNYFSLINRFTVPTEEYERRTDSKQDGSYFNFAPEFSPDGLRYVYFSNQGARYSVWLGGTYGLSDARKIITGEASAAMEEFYYFRSNLSWFPDNRRIAFVAKTATGDKIHIADVESGRIIQSISIQGISSIYEIDVSPRGDKLLLAGQMGLQTDIFEYSLETSALTRLTNDAYDDLQPRYSQNTDMICFSSEREGEGASSGFFDDYHTEVFVLNRSDGRLRKISSDEENASKPRFTEDGTMLYYLSDISGISNYKLVNLTDGGVSNLTNCLSGVYNADISTDQDYMLLSIYFDGAWNIYMADSPLAEIKPFETLEIKSLETVDNLMKRIDLAQLDYFGRKTRTRIPRVNPTHGYDPRRPFFEELAYAQEDSLRSVLDNQWDIRPDSIGTIPVVQPYKTKFHLDSFWGGLSYSSAIGAIGNLELGFSDLMGNHGIGVNLGIEGRIEDSNILLSYLYLKNRTDYGFGVYNLFDQSIYRSLTNNPEDDYFRVRQRETGLYFLVRYPISKFLRIDFDNRLYQWRYHLDSWDWSADYQDGQWIEDNYPVGTEFEPLTHLVYTPGISLVHDNALYGSTGPLVGWRAMYSVRKSFAGNDMDYLTNYLDWRSYSLFSKRYSIANRFIGAISTGSNPQRFDLGGYYGVRAYDGDLSGEKKVMLASEVRFPFFDYISMAFPVPLVFSNIRGAAFMDIGGVWDKNSDFRGMRDGKLNDLYMGYGFGPRINLGYFVLKLDLAWLTDLSDTSKPFYYLSLTEDF